MPTIDSHPSVEEAALRKAAIASLRGNRIDPKFLYVTPLQAELWREVSRKHSPLHTNPEFERIYREAFTQLVGQISAKKVRLIGLGCGTGQKEAALAEELIKGGCAVEFTAIDISRDLVAESVQRLAGIGATHLRSLTCDLAEAESIGRWLNDLPSDLPRAITFFGLFPNFPPSTLARLFRAILRPGDVMIASAHLVPSEIDRASSRASAMKSILPQYDNLETHAWLAAALKAWNLETHTGPPTLRIGTLEGIPAFIGEARWKSREPFEKWGRPFSPVPEDPLRVFFSLRYSPRLFETKLRLEGFRTKLLSLTSCRQEGIWCIRPG